MNKEQTDKIIQDAEDTTETAADTTEDTPDTADDTTEDTPDTADDTAEDTAEDNLELHNMKLKDRIAAKKARYKKYTEDMSKGQKYKYFLYYYKGRLLLFAFLIFLCIAIPVTIYNKTRPVSIAYAVINCTDPKGINTSLFEDYRNFYTFEEPNQIIDDKEIHLSLDEYNENTIHSANSTDYSQFPMLCHNNYYDIVFTDEKGLLFCSTNSVVLTLEAGLPKDLYQILEEDYSDLIVEAPNYNDDPVPFAIDISDTDFAKDLNLGYSPVYVCVPGNSERNMSNIKKMINFILDLGMEL